MATGTGYVRNAFVLCCFGEYSEFNHLKKIIHDAISTTPIDNSVETEDTVKEKSSKHEKYYTEDYKPTPHEYIEEK